MNPAYQSIEQKAMLTHCQTMCNAFPVKGNYVIDNRILGVVTGHMRKILGHGTKKDDLILGRTVQLQMLSWIYNRKITTTKVGAEGGLQPHEAMGLLIWAQPGKLSVNSPWTCAARVHKTCEAFEALHLGQTQMDLGM